MSWLPFRRRKCRKDELAQLSEHPSSASVLSAETEAFVNGRMAEHLAAVSRPVPAWAVLNKLAHASAPELAAITRLDPDASDLAAPAWHGAQVHLASCLLRRGAAPDEIRQIQRMQLIPLELSFIEQSKTRIVTSREVISAAHDALKPRRQSGW
jgi:hypothetical protein